MYYIKKLQSLELAEVSSKSSVWVRLGVEHSSSKSSSSHEGNSSDNSNSDSPAREQVVHVDVTLLSSVGEVVVSGAHVVELSGFVHADESSIKVSGRVGVELHAIGLVGLNGVLVVGVVSHQLGQSLAVGLSQIGKVLSEFGVIKQ